MPSPLFCSFHSTSPASFSVGTQCRLGSVPSRSLLGGRKQCGGIGSEMQARTKCGGGPWGSVLASAQSCRTRHREALDPVFSVALCGMLSTLGQLLLLFKAEIHLCLLGDSSRRPAVLTGPHHRARLLQARISATGRVLRAGAC